MCNFKLRILAGSTPQSFFCSPFCEWKLIWTMFALTYLFGWFVWAMTPLHNYTSAVIGYTLCSFLIGIPSFILLLALIEGALRLYQHIKQPDPRDLRIPIYKEETSTQKPSTSTPEKPFTYPINDTYYNYNYQQV